MFIYKVSLKAAVYNGTSTGLEKLSSGLSPMSYPGKFIWPIYSSLVYMQPCESITDNLILSANTEPLANDYKI